MSEWWSDFGAVFGGIGVEIGSDKYLALLVLHPGLDLLAETFALVQAGKQQQTVVFLLYGREVLEAIVGEVPGLEVVVHLFLAEVERQVAEDDGEPVMSRSGDQLE